jgi:hypothetical protein
METPLQVNLPLLLKKQSLLLNQLLNQHLNQHLHPNQPLLL